MYIEVTIDLKHYTGERFDLRLSDYHSVKKVIEIAWQAKKISSTPKEGYWVRVPNKNVVFAGHQKLNECGISSGDCIEIL